LVEGVQDWGFWVKQTYAMKKKSLVVYNSGQDGISLPGEVPPKE